MHQAHGALEAKEYPNDPIDEEGSQAISRSTFVPRAGQAIKASDDTIYSGYTRQGLPFMLVVDGYYMSPKEEVAEMRRYIDEEILSMTAIYADKLSKSKTEDEIKQLNKSLAEDIERNRSKDERRQCAPFTLSLAVMHQNDENDVFVSGFGIGDTGIVLIRDNAADIQLAHHNKIYKDDGSTDKEGFEFSAVEGEFDQDKFTQKYNRSSSFARIPVVGENIQLLGYTSLDPTLEDQENEEACDQNDPVVKRRGYLRVAHLGLAAEFKGG